MDHEEPLAGGNASGVVVRVGTTVRKPWTSATPNVVGFVETVRRAGVDAPAPRGRDERGRQVLEFVPGPLAIDAAPRTAAELRRVGAMVRAVHDASPTWTAGSDRTPTGRTWDVLIPPPTPADLVCHNDLAPWNLVIGDRWVFIDWDGAGPSTRLWDLAYAAQTFTLNDVHRAPEVSAQDLAAFVDGYGADRPLRAALPDAMAERAAAMHELLRDAHASGREPWGSMYASGHGAHWSAATAYAREHRDVWFAALLTDDAGGPAPAR